MMHTFLCPAGLEFWDHSRPEGIAGSETCVVELSRRLARRGHDVRVYAPTFPDTTADPASGVPWRSIQDPDITIDTDDPGVFWLCRHPPLLDHFEGGRYDQKLFLRCDDLHYGQSLTPERYAKLDHILLMSGPQRDYFRQVYPFVEESRTSTLGCGIATDRMAKLVSRVRDPYRIAWTSNPDRGLEHCIDVFHKARRYKPQLNLHVYYGWNGLDAAVRLNPDHPYRDLKRRILAMDQTGITWHGRTGKEVLWKDLLETNLWLYTNTFPEAGVVSAMEAQALGAIPVCPPAWGLAEKVKHGVLIGGDVADAAVREQYVDAVLALARNPDLCEDVRATMMPWARAEYDWDRVVDHHENLAGCLGPYLLRTTTPPPLSGRLPLGAR